MRLDIDPELRRRIELALEDAARGRPYCCLVSSVGADEDGRTYVHFTCLDHGATWRDYVADRARGKFTTGDVACEAVCVGALEESGPQVRGVGRGPQTDEGGCSDEVPEEA